MAKAKRTKAKKAFYGIAEWYGRLYHQLSDADRKEFADTKNTSMDCPYVGHGAGRASKSTKCSKKGGVCSIRNFTESKDQPNAIEFGPITTTCPNRFLEDGTIITEISRFVLGTNDPQVAKELPFLMRDAAQMISDDEDQSEESDREDVGRIDLVFVHPQKEPLDWCAVEMQAVYFSGGAMSKDLAVVRTYSGNGLPMPAVARRPDFRSSGPKRLMPQLQIKVPTLRRWGKKMVVVIDRPFLEAMGPMRTVSDISNSDIVWVVVSYPEVAGSAKLEIDQVILTTLEDAVEGLTAGHPTTLSAFERKLRGKITLDN